MRCRCRCPPPPPPLPLLLLLPLLGALAGPCPVLLGGDPQTKAYLAPLVFHGTLTATERRGPLLRASFTVERVVKGAAPPPRPVVVEFAARENPARCRGAPAPGDLSPGRRYVVFAAWRRRKLIATATPEDYSRRKAVNRVLCDKCAKAPSIRHLRDGSVEALSKLKLKCRISGNPPPRVTWFKNGLRIRAGGRIRIRSKRRYSQLVIGRAGLEDGGRYECRAANVLGNSTASALVAVHNTQSSTTDSTLWHFKKKPCPRKNICLNDGICTYYEVVREYVCECAEGYRGQRCESKAISSLSSPPPVDPPKALHDIETSGRLLLQHHPSRGR